MVGPGLRRDAFFLSTADPLWRRTFLTAARSAGNFRGGAEAGHGDVSRRGAGRPAALLGQADPGDGAGAGGILAGACAAAGAAAADDRGGGAVTRPHAGRGRDRGW